MRGGSLTLSDRYQADDQVVQTALCCQRRARERRLGSRLPCYRPGDTRALPLGRSFEDAADPGTYVHFERCENQERSSGYVDVHPVKVR